MCFIAQGHNFQGYFFFNIILYSSPSSSYHNHRQVHHSSRSQVEYQHWLSDSEGYIPYLILYMSGRKREKLNGFLIHEQLPVYMIYRKK
jgi:hypothetical protein